MNDLPTSLPPSMPTLLRQAQQSYSNALRAALTDGGCDDIPTPPACRSRPRWHPVKPVPVMVTVVPPSAGPEVGLSWETVGAATVYVN